MSSGDRMRVDEPGEPGSDGASRSQTDQIETPARCISMIQGGVWAR
jgi:hypothetical protein